MIRTLPAALLAVVFAAPVVAADLPTGAFARLGGGEVLRHAQRPNALAVSPDGKLVASGGMNGTLNVWDGTTGQRVFQMKQKGAAAVGVAFTGDGKFLAAGFEHRGTLLLEVGRNFKEAARTELAVEDGLTLSADGGLIAGPGGVKTLRLVSTATDLDRMTVADGPAVAVAPDGLTVAAVAADGEVTVCAVPSGKVLHTLTPPKGEAARFLAYSGDSSKVAVAGSGPKAKVRVHTLGAKGAATFDGEGPVAVAGDRVLFRRDERLVVANVKTGAPVYGLGDGVSTFAASADGTRAACDGGGVNASSRIRLYDLTTGKELARPDDELLDVREVAPVAGGAAWVVTAQRAVAWTPGTPPTTAATFDAPVVAAAVAGRSLFTADAGRVLRFDLPAAPGPITAKPATITGMSKGVRVLSASADGSVLAAATRGAAPVLAVSAGAKVERSWPLPSPPLGVSVAPDGKTVVVLGRDGVVRAWDRAAAAAKAPADQPPPEKWTARAARSPRGAVTHSPDGRLLAVVTMMTVKVLDAATGAAVVTFTRADIPDGPFVSAAFSPDGRLLAAGTLTANSVVVWELLTRTQAARFDGPEGAAQTLLRFADGGRSLLAVGSDETLTAWDVSGRRGKPAPTDDELATAWGQLSRPGADAGWAAVNTLAAGGAKGVPVVRDGITRGADAEGKIDALIADLGSADFKVRDAASTGLVAIGGAALPAVRKAAAETTSAEVKARAEAVAAKLAADADLLPDPKLAGEPLRRFRAAAVLEAVGGPDAQAELERIVKLRGPAADDAARALKRLGER